MNVEIDRMTLATLIDEAQYTVDSIGDPEWHENQGKVVKEAIAEAEEVLEASEE